MKGNRSNGATQQAHYNFNAIQPHLQALNRRLIELLGDDYAIDFDKPRRDTNNNMIYFATRCIYYTHNDDHYDEDPSGWIGVSLVDGRLISGCWVCERKQFVYHYGEFQPAPTLLTLSRRDPHLLKVLVALGCEEVTEVNGRPTIAVAFPLTYTDGLQGFHYRVAWEG
jgi:hypothetical protein